MPINKRNKKNGFTLIELMIVVAIIGILASIALPAYQTYVAKSKITSITATVAAVKTDVFNFYVDKGAMPKTPDFQTGGSLSHIYTLFAEGLPGPIVYGWGTQGDLQGYFAITLKEVNANVNGKTIFYTMADKLDVMTMTCTATSIDNKYLPKLCQH